MANVSDGIKPVGNSPQMLIAFQDTMEHLWNKGEEHDQSSRLHETQDLHSLGWRPGIKGSRADRGRDPAESSDRNSNLSEIPKGLEYACLPPPPNGSAIGRVG